MRKSIEKFKLSANILDANTMGRLIGGQKNGGEPTAGGTIKKGEDTYTYCHDCIDRDVTTYYFDNQSQEECSCHTN